MGNKRTPEIRFAGFSGDWEQRKIGNVYFFKNGLNKGKEFFGSGTPIVNFTDVFHNRGLLSKNLKGKVQLTQKEINNFEVQQGDIFFTRTSETIEEIGYPSVMIDNPINTVFSGFVLRGRAIENDPLVLDFKRYVFFTNAFRAEMKKKSSMTTRALTSGTAIKEMLFNYPKSQVEQEKIGKTFKQLDDTIALHQQELTALKQTKQGFLQKMFPKEGEAVPEVRFPGFSGDWEQRKLEDITESYSGGTPSAGNKSYYGGNIPFIRSAEINSESTELFITEDGFNNSSAKMVEEGDILYALYGATSGEVSISKMHGAINQAILAIKPVFSDDSYLITQWLKKQKKIIVNTYLQGGQGNLSGSIVKNLIITLPSSKDEQVKIGNFFKQLDDTIDLHQRELEILKETKKAFLQKMFV